jgi:hypothetical protein
MLLYEKMQVVLRGASNPLFFVYLKCYNLFPMKLKRFITLFLIFLGVYGLSAQSAKRPESPFWWQVELRISVSGEYSYREDDKGFDGNYAFTNIILGSMHEDDDDYIFLQVHQETQDLKWKETVFENDLHREFNLSEKINPGVEFNYVFHDKGVLMFDFNIKPIAVPNKCSIFTSAVKRLQFHGSSVDKANHVEIADNDIYNNKENNRVFEWKREKESADSDWKNSHHVKAALKIIRLLKKEKT